MLQLAEDQYSNRLNDAKDDVEEETYLYALWVWQCVSMLKCTQFHKSKQQRTGLVAAIAIFDVVIFLQSARELFVPTAAGKVSSSVSA